MNKFIKSLLAVIFLPGVSVYSQSDNTVKRIISDYFANYQTAYTSTKDICKVTNFDIDKKDKSIFIHTNEIFYGQSFSEEKVKLIYDELKNKLPSEYKSYKIHVYGGRFLIEDLIANPLRKKSDKNLTWNKVKYNGIPWVENTDKPFQITEGLYNRHIALWASHGRFYKNQEDKWIWQRPYLYGTTEDLFTQTFVVPFLIPMLENSGAYIVTPRERNWQKEEKIVDNDTPTKAGIFKTINNKHKWILCNVGFAHNKNIYTDNENPFKDGTSLKAKTVKHKSQQSEIIWVPEIEKDGEYAVYVSYSTTDNSVDDAIYSVIHKGITTNIRVNQKMGGGTWVYIGTFDFEASRPNENYVSLTNFSNYNGEITADAVRFGGGMGNIARGDSTQIPKTSGMPRFLEGARYYAQWCGMPYDVYSGQKGNNDYADDINTRSRMINYLASGSCYLPNDTGLNVPLEMSVAIHSDAGIAKERPYIGTLGIYTTDFNDGILPYGIPRLTSRSLCDLIISQINNDITCLYGEWQQRQMMDRNYSETREPRIPSVIIETLSHQNFSDMRMGHDPNFKFNLSRAIYKGILKYSASMHNTEYTVQPLPVVSFSTNIDEENEKVILSWEAQKDNLEPSSKADGFIVYTSIDNKGYDNGKFTPHNNITVDIDKGKLYSFKITAVNKGGESFSSEELVAYIAPESKGKILIINGFNRLAGPQVIQDDSISGFDLSIDMGVSYKYSAEWAGNQIDFQNYSIDHGLCGNEMEGHIIAGNTFDYAVSHGKSIKMAGNFSFASSSRQAVENGTVSLHEFDIVDLILGLQKDDGYSLKRYPSLTDNLCKILQEYTRMRGNILVSGAYIGRDQKTNNKLDFLKNTLKITAYSPLKLNSSMMVSGMNTNFELYTLPNEEHYAVSSADCIMPENDAFSILLYSPENYSAAIAYPGNNYRAITLGFPFECIRSEKTKAELMNAFLSFLSSKE